jgi:hypothetical protein
MRLLACVFLLAYPSLASLPRAGAAEFQSPDGHIRAEVDVRDGSLQYRIELDGDEMLAWSPLGLDSTAGDFRTGVKLTGISTNLESTESYDLAAGKASHIQTKSQQTMFSVANTAGRQLQVWFRASNDGIAFRYIRSSLRAEVGMPAAHDTDYATITAEATGFAFPAGTTTFLHPMAVSKSGWMRTQPSYEEYYLYDQPVGEPSPLGQGWCLPALFKVADRGWVLIGETGVDASYFGARLASDSSGGVYRIDLPQEAEHLAESPVQPSVDTEQPMPWRFVLVGKTLAPIVASTMATDLVEPLYELDWKVKPGRAAWSWLPLKDDNITEPVQRKFIDMAAALKFEYVLIDNWWDQKIGREKIAELVAYARGKGVDVILWYNSNGDWNDAPQTPQDRMHTPEVRAEEMAWLQKIGVKGLKVDFFGGDKQAVMALYDGILRDSAKYGLCINFHGATIPRGWDRMYPNFVTCEAVRGMEFCTFEQANADHEPEHCATLPFTRNVIGPMDFTPVMVGEGLSPGGGRPRRRTTLAFELALPVVFYSAAQHFGLVPEDLDRLPRFAINYLREVPTTWDETRLVDGYPGRLAVLARRKGERWYIGAINGSKETQRVTIPADMASAWSVISDDNQGGLAHETAAIEAGKPLEIELPSRGGAILISP